MRKVILEISPFEHVREEEKETFRHIESYQVLQVIKIDYAGGMFVDVIECITKEGENIEEIEMIGQMEVLNVLRSKGNKHICLVEGHRVQAELDMDLIWTTPSMIAPDRIIISFMGPQKSIVEFVEIVRGHVGEIINMTFQKASYEKGDILSILTDRQREIMAAANRHGYYEIPRKISSVELAEKLEIAKPTMLEHLRKAESRLLTNIFAGIIGR